MGEQIGTLRVHRRADDACVASLGPFSLCRVYGEFTVESVAATLVAQSAALEARPDGVGSITIVDASTPIPSDEVRRAARDAVKRATPHVRADALVIRGDGFWAGALRGAITALGAISSAGHPRKTFRDEAEAVRWVVETLAVERRYELALRHALEDMSQSGAAHATAP